MIQGSGNVAHAGRGAFSGYYLASLWADYHPFFRQGAGERYCCAERQRTAPQHHQQHQQQQQQRCVIRQLQAEAHRAWLVDKTSWKERKANSCAKFFF